jgi:hypothetical protein
VDSGRHAAPDDGCSSPWPLRARPGDQPATARHFETAVACAGDPAAFTCGEAAPSAAISALRAAEEAVAQAPGSAAARTLLGGCRAQQQYENAAAQLTQATA